MHLMMKVLRGNGLTIMIVQWQTIPFFGLEVSLMEGAGKIVLFSDCQLEDCTIIPVTIQIIHTPASAKELPSHT